MQNIITIMSQPIRKERNEMQINRLFEIIYILLDKKVVTAKELADRFEVSVRTIYRDVETLSGAGIPIYMNRGKGGGITLLPEFVLNKTVITEQEKADILSSLSGLGAVSLNEMNTTIKKLTSLFGGTNMDWIEVAFGLWSDGEREAVLFQTIKQSIIQKQVICFEYVTAKGENMSREVEPLKLVFKGTAWYLYAYCRLREDYRFFKLKRMRDLVVMGERFVRRIPERIFTQSEQPKKPEMIKVKVRFEKEFAYLAYDDFESCEMQKDGSVLAESWFWKMDWMAEQILGYGEACEVLEPPELRTVLKEKLEKMLNKYLN